MSGEYSKGRERRTTLRDRINRFIGEKATTATAGDDNRNFMGDPPRQGDYYDDLWHQWELHREDPRVVVSYHGYPTDNLPAYWVDINLMDTTEGGMPGIHIVKQDDAPYVHTPQVNTAAEGLKVLGEIEQHGPEKVDAKYRALQALQSAEYTLKSQQGTPEYCDARTEELVGEIEALQREIENRQAEIARLEELRAESPAREAECAEVVAARRAEYEAAVAQLEAPDA